MKRKLIHHLFRSITGLCAMGVFFVLLIVVGSICKRGAPAISWDFFSQQMRAAGASGGILYNILGTSILIGTAALFSLPVATAVALIHSVYLKNQKLRGGIMLLIYILNGIPSILIGIFGMILFVQYLNWGKSWLAGGMLLALMILPTIAVSVISRMEAIPKAQIEAATGLGMRRSQIVRSVVLPRSKGGLLTGLFLGLARAAGETAPIMFTATIFAGATVPSGIKENPVLSLPYHIFVLAQDSLDPAASTKLWGTALTLILLVSALSLVALALRIKITATDLHD